MSIQRVTTDSSSTPASSSSTPDQPSVSQVAQAAITSSAASQPTSLIGQAIRAAAAQVAESIAPPARAAIPLSQEIAFAARSKYEFVCNPKVNIAEDCRKYPIFAALIPWLEKKSELTQQMAMSAIRKAIILQRPHVVYYILGHGPALPDGAYTALLKLSIKHQMFEVVEFLFSCGVSVSTTYLALQARQLALKWEFRTLPRILHHLKTPFVGFEEMVVMATAMRLKACVIQLLCRCPISAATRDAALRIAENRELIEALQSAAIAEPLEEIPAELAVADPVQFLLSERSQMVEEYQALKEWLTSHRPVSEDALEAAFCHAAVTAPTDVVRFLLSKRKPIDEDELAEVVNQVASFGRVATVRFLLSEGRTLEQMELFSAAKVALASGQAEMFRFLVSIGGDHPQEHIDVFFNIAASGSSWKSAYPEMIVELLTLGKKPSQNCLGSSVAKAAGSGSIEVLRLLLADGRTLEPGQLMDAMVRAAWTNNPEILQLLLPDERMLSEDQIGTVFVDAARPTSLRCVEFFLSGGRTVAERFVAQAMRNAAFHGESLLVNFLFGTGIVRSQEMFGWVIEAAIDSRQQEIARWLLARYPGDFDRRQPSVMLAAQHNLLDIIEELLRRGPISELLRDSALSLTTDARIRDLLNMVAVIPAGAGPEEAIDRSRLMIPLAGLKEYPERWLQHVAGRGLPARVRFIEFPLAIDLGGVMKQFISTLCEGLIEKKVFSRQASGLMTCESEREAIPLRRLGKFFSDIARRNEKRSDHFLTGRVCHPRFFEFAVIAMQEKSRQEKLHEAARLLDACDPTQHVVAQVVLNPTVEACTQFQAIMLSHPGDEVTEAETIVGSYLNAAAEIYHGALEPFKTQMIEDPIGALLSLQGEEASREGLIHALILEAEGARATAYFQWIKEEIAAADLDFRKKFLKAVTGKTSLAPGDRIKVKETWRADGVFEIHTCFNMLDLPRVDLTRDELIQALRVCLDEQYNIA
jgi:hypothetical protein